MKLKDMGKRLVVLGAVGLLSVSAAMTAQAAVKLGTVSDVYWDEDNQPIAVWEEVENAYQYEVYLYCDGNSAGSVKTKKTRYNFEKKMNKEGEYTFRVRALAKNKDKKFSNGNWSDYSDETYIDESYAELIRNGGIIDTQNSGPGAAAGTGNSTQVPTTNVVYTPQWIQDSVGWWYRLADGTYPTNTWWQDPANGSWYYFNEHGYMMTGWIQWNGSWYYCQPSGVMVTGENTIDGTIYWFDGSGALLAS